MYEKFKEAEKNLNITSKSNKLITEIAKLKQKKHRDEQNLFFVEGAKLAKEALNSDFNVKYIINVGADIIRPQDYDITDVMSLGRPHRIAPTGRKPQTITVTREVYEKITDEDGFEGIMCVIEKPNECESIKYDKPVIILDNLQNPGNVGTIIRTNEALCRADIILTGNCADIYSPKTQRAAMGAIFRQNIKISKNIETELEILKKNGYNIFATYLDDNSRSVENVDLSGKCAVIFGSEGVGLDASIASFCDERIIIPINAGSESLNVAIAAGIILWEMRK